MSKNTLQCHSCKQSFPKNILVAHASNRAKQMYNYCPKCLKEKQEGEYFFDKVCEIFGIKAPGPIIYTQRKRIKDKYGYTDQTIIDCLEYVYKIENKKKLSESLYFVQPEYVDKMLKYKNQENIKQNKIASAAANFQTQTYIVPIKENNTVAHKTQYENIDDWLEE